VEADYAQDQVHFTKTLADLVWSASYKTEQMALGGWGQSTSHPNILSTSMDNERISVIYFCMKPVLQKYM